MSELIQIPPITDPLGRFWDQPKMDRILIDDKCAMMSKETFDELLEYSTTRPSGVYAGKCWKANRGGKWYLRWYAEDDGDPRGLPTPWREIVLL